MGILTIAAPFLGILLDAYGVFWGGGTGVIPGSHETMAQLVASGKIVGILSNSSQSGEKERVKFEKHGLIQGTHYHFVITSGDIARELFLSQDLPFPLRHNQYWILGEPHPKFSSPATLFEGTAFSQTDTLEAADFIHLAIPHQGGEDQTDPTLFKNAVLELVSSGLPMVCVNPDTFAHEGNPPRPVVRQGSLAALYADAGGTVFFIGKPSKLAFDTAFQAFQNFTPMDPHQILMVGDTPETDIRGGKAYGMRTALITKIGIFAERGEALSTLPPSDQPDDTLEQFPDDIYNIPKQLEESGFWQGRASTFGFGANDHCREASHE
jgi:HAD superfamily hydrolase (TIGR01459 family)